MLQARIHTLNQPIGHDITCSAEDAGLGTLLTVTFPSRAQPTWRMWLDIANGLLVFMERFEYVEFAYKVRDGRGTVVGVGDLADFP